MTDIKMFKSNGNRKYPPCVQHPSEVWPSKQQQTHWVPPLTTRGDRWMSTSLPAPDKNKNMSLNGIRSQPWQQQSPPPQVDVKKSPLRSDWHTGRSWLTLSNIAFSPKRRKRKAASPVFLVMHFRLFPSNRLDGIADLEGMKVDPRTAAAAAAEAEEL